jgi:hypothetical protein
VFEEGYGLGFEGLVDTGQCWGVFPRKRQEDWQVPGLVVRNEVTSSGRK